MAAKKKVPVLEVTAKSERFRRAGISFSKNVTRLVVADLKDEQIKAIKAEPMLSVVEVTADVSTETPAE
jgi:hypothetical protein